MALPLTLPHFTGDKGVYKVMLTKDGSPTLWSESFDETCHSVDGADIETDAYYVQGCKVEEGFSTLPLFPLLEIGFGTGQGFDRTVLALSRGKIPDNSSLFYVAVEQDEAMVRKCLELFPSPDCALFPRRVDLRPGLRWNIPCLEANAPRGTLIVLIGDARKTLPALLAEGSNQLPPFRAIYQDAFSPRKNPLLWTVEWFEMLKALSHQECLLSTFSASSRVRKSMLEAGWKVNEGKRIGPKRASTLSSLQGESSPALLEKLQRSPVSSLTDRSLSL